MALWLRTLLALGLAAATMASSQSGFRVERYQTDFPYDGRFTFLRVRWGRGSNFFGGMSNAWNHDYPRAEQHLSQILKEVTLIDIRTDGARILPLDDPELFKYPIAYMWEPGFWSMTDREAERFREYLLKGGFAIFDDFDGQQWNNFEAQMRRVLGKSTGLFPFDLSNEAYKLGVNYMIYGLTH